MKDMYKKRWKAVMMTDKNTYEAVVQSLGLVIEAYVEMTKGQVYDLKDPKDMEELLKDLDDKLPKTCDIWKMFDSFRTNARFQGVSFEIRSFDQWCHMIMLAIERWPRAVVDKARVAVDRAGASDGGPVIDSEGAVLTPWSADWDDQNSEAVRRLDDVRNALGQKKPTKYKAFQGSVPKAVLDAVPRCRD
jgi:hypothetical protein